jgi:hypothetical protein
MANHVAQRKNIKKHSFQRFVGKRQGRFSSYFWAICTRLWRAMCTG